MSNDRANEMAKALIERASALKEAKQWVRQNQKPGAFPDLPPLLEKRRLEYGIPDGAFSMHALYGRILIWQIALDEEERFKGSVLFKANVTQDKEQYTAPKGIIVSAGLSALDYLRANGSDLGHKVAFVRLSPYAFEVDRVGRGIPQELVILQAGDLIADYDLQESVRKGESQVVQDKCTHFYRDAGGFLWKQNDPALEPDY